MNAEQRRDASVRREPVEGRGCASTSSARTVDGSGSRQPRLSWAAPASALAALWACADALGGRVPGWPEVAGGASLLGALAYAAADLSSGGFVRAVVRGPSAQRAVALTFDDGPDPETTPRVLATLAEEHARATFFVLAEKAARQRELVARIQGAGHEIASHGERHDWRLYLTPRRGRESLARAQAAFAELLGTPPSYFRPPYGVATPALRSAVAALGLTVVGWSIRTRDAGRRGDPERCTATTLARARPGSIILLHDAPERVGGRLPLGPRMLPALLAGLRERGLATMTISELLGTRA